MNVQSKVGEGTTVAVALPLRFAPPVVSEPASNVATLTPAPRSTPIEQPYQVKKSA
jgi:cell cycle sensor histidine kinase DivJ